MEWYESKYYSPERNRDVVKNVGELIHELEEEAQRLDSITPTRDSWDVIRRREMHVLISTANRLRDILHWMKVG